MEHFNSTLEHQPFPSHQRKWFGSKELWTQIFNQKLYEPYRKLLISVSVNCTEPFSSRSIKNFDTPDENSSTVYHNPNPFKKETDCFTELKLFN